MKVFSVICVLALMTDLVAASSGDLSSGVTTLNGRNREEALRTDTKEYQRFRQIWSDLRSGISALIPKHGDAYTGSTALNLPKWQ